MKHTPGPWRAVSTRYPIDDTIITSTGAHVAIVPSAIRNGATTPELRNTHIANARLIAAAPDLADMLGWALNLIEDDPEHQQAFAHARAVLAQALGES